ncbi:MAG: Mini-ribonuclease 3 [Peptococcaceae bacterium]
MLSEGEVLNMFYDFAGDPAQLPSLTLAYIGDAVYELYIREFFLNKGEVKARQLHKQVIKRVNAGSQAKFYEKIENMLTELELSVAKRGRNAKSGQIPKNALVTDYRKSTGFEALIGYLFLKKDDQRIQELLTYLLDEQ